MEKKDLHPDLMKVSKNVSAFQLVGFIFLAAILLSSCSSSSRVRSVVYEDLYRIDKEFSHDAFVRQSSPDSAYVQFRLRTGHLLHKRKDKESPFNIDVEFAVITQSDKNIVSDTMNFSFNRTYNEVSDELVYGRFTIPFKDTTAYEVRIFLMDNFSMKETRFIEFYERDGYDARFNRILVNGVPTRYCACELGDELIFFPYGWGEGSLKYRSYTVEQGLAPPPFSINSTPSPTFKLLDEYDVDYNGGVSIPCPQADMIEFEQESLNALLQIPVFQINYPYITQHLDMIEALKYITTSNEYKAMIQSDDLRNAVEEFWIDCAGSKERARVLIGQYYSRVEEANKFFTETKEGWKTDRGLINIVYGPPSRVMRYPDREIWYYGTDNSDNTLKITFFKNNGYTMDRSLDYRQSWYLTVDSWRNGRTINP
ncbi:MAG: GWxTD domain-containing protein [Flavobacteriales bacterium]|nr:GWxTD domain-containing protein [Flavobacteriales bacterium]